MIVTHFWCCTLLHFVARQGRCRTAQDRSRCAVGFMRLALSILAGLPLATSVSFAQSLFPTNRGETILAGGSGRGINLPHNDCATIAREANGREVYGLLLPILKLPNNTSVRYLVGEHCNVQVSTLGLKKEIAQAFATLLRGYVNSRGSGHTAQYALDSLRQRLLPPTTETNGYRAALFESFPDLPRDWVKEDPFHSQILTTNSTLFQQFVVLDGEIAWTYVVPLGNGRVWPPVRVDAKE